MATPTPTGRTAAHPAERVPVVAWLVVAVLLLLDRATSRPRA